MVNFDLLGVSARTSQFPVLALLIAPSCFARQKLSRARATSCCELSGFTDDLRTTNTPPTPTTSDFDFHISHLHRTSLNCPLFTLLSLSPYAQDVCLHLRRPQRRWHVCQGLRSRERSWPPRWSPRRRKGRCHCMRFRDHVEIKSSGDGSDPFCQAAANATATATADRNSDGTFTKGSEAAKEAGHVGGLHAAGKDDAAVRPFAIMSRCRVLEMNLTPISDQRHHRRRPQRGRHVHQGLGGREGGRPCRRPPRGRKGRCRGGFPLAPVLVVCFGDANQSSLRPPALRLERELPARRK